LIANKADVNFNTQDHETILMMLCTKGYADLAKLLIDNGALVNAQTTYKATALMAACRNRHADVVKVLIAANADLTIKDENGEMALDHAKRAGDQESVALLEKAVGDKQ
jgi:ankyrin repeat protein